MTLALRPPLAAMEALSVSEIPHGPEWQYEPKWDGFRCLAFRDGDHVELQSKSGQPLVRYFPEIAEAVRQLKPRAFVLDGEIVIPADGAFSFDALLQRIHPAASRVKRLAVDTPGLFIVFDLLADAEGRSLLDLTLSERRQHLGKFAAQYLRGAERIRLSPATTALSVAKGWLERVGATLDGIIAKRRDLPYRSEDRSGMQKIKNYRSADCVVGGFRYGTGKRHVGSLLLGLYDEAGLPAPCRLHIGHQGGRAPGAHQKTRGADRTPRLHRQRSGRPEPLVDRTLRPVGTAHAQARRRGRV